MSQMLSVICSPEAGRGVHVENQKEEDDLMMKMLLLDDVVPDDVVVARPLNSYGNKIRSEVSRKRSTSMLLPGDGLPLVTD